MSKTTASHEIEDIEFQSKKWDEGCRSDPIRNQLIIPKISGIMENIKAKRIIDIGCGTGYISREISERVSHQAEWTWLDKNRYRLEYGRSLLKPDMNVDVIEGDIFDIQTRLEPFDLLILVFTILETGCDCALADRLFEITAKLGHLIVVIPDVWTDVLADHEPKLTAHELVKAQRKIHKIDDFTGRPYPFIATRTELVVARLTAAGFCLETLDILNLGKKKNFSNALQALIVNIVMDEKKNAYLALASRAISETREPMTPKQMLELASKQGFLPSHLYGDTMHKTLQARLSEAIQRQGSKSAFYRTKPGTFFLQSLAEMPSTPSEYKNVYKGNRRSKQIRKEDVLVMDRERLKAMIYGEFVHFDHDAFSEIHQNECFYMDRRTAELDTTVKQFVTFTLVHHGHKLLVYRRGKFTTTSDRLKGQMTVGFGGHVNDKDFDLFHRAGDGLRNNAARELRESYFWTKFTTISRRQLNAQTSLDILTSIAPKTPSTTLLF